MQHTVGRIKMNEFNIAELINDTKSLNEKGIYKGNSGVLISYNHETGDWLVMYSNPKNLGDYAVAYTNEKNLKFVGVMSDRTVSIYKEIVKRPDFFDHTELMLMKLKEYDRVELAVDKEIYLNENVRKGMRGCIMSEQAILGEHQVIFSEDGTGKDIADIMVLEEDLLLV